MRSGHVDMEHILSPFIHHELYQHTMEEILLFEVNDRKVSKNGPCV